MARTDDAWVRDIIPAIADIRADTAVLDFAAFAARPAIVRSVLYSIAILGEAAKNISPAFKVVYPDVPWRAIAGIRDRIVHEYFRTNTRRIWDVVTDDIDELEKGIGPFIGPPAGRGLRVDMTPHFAGIAGFKKLQVESGTDSKVRYAHAMCPAPQ
jgi:uncharacterized protein with HEPN domain